MAANGSQSVDLGHLREKAALALVKVVYGGLIFFLNLKQSRGQFGVLSPV